MSQVYQQALQRALSGLSSTRESGPDTGFCTSTPDNSRIKTSRSIGYSADNDDIKTKNDTNSQNQYNKYLTNNSSSNNTGYQGRYNYRYTSQPESKSSAENINSDSTNDRSSNVNSDHTSRYSNSSKSYLHPDSSNRYGNSSNRSVSPARTPERSVSPTPGYRIPSRYRTSSPRPQDTSSESKQNIAPVSPSLLGSVEYLGRYKPRFSSSSDQGNNSRPSTPTRQSASRSSNDTAARETTTSQSSEGSPGYSGRYQYRYPSRAYNYGSSVTSNQESGNNLTSGSRSTASAELSPASSSAFRYSSTSQHSPKDSRTQESSNRESNSPAYRYSYSSQGSPKTETNQESVTSPSQPVTISTTYQYRYPSRNSQQTTQSSNSTETETPEKKSEDTSVFRYPYRYSSQSTQNRNQTQEEQKSDDKEEEWTTTTETYKVPKKSISSQNSKDQTQIETSKSENQREEVKTSSDSYRYPYSSRSSFRSTQNQNQPIESSEKTETKEEEEDEGWTTTTETYRYPKTKNAHQTSSVAQDTKTETSKSSETSTQSSRFRYPYSSRYSSSANEPKAEPEKPKSPEPQVKTEVSSNSYRYPRYGSSSTETKVAEPEDSRKETPEPESPTLYSYRSPYSRFSSSQPVTSTPIKTEEQPVDQEQEQSRSRYTYKYPSRYSSYGNSSSHTEKKNTEPVEKETEVTSNSYSYRYPRSNSSIGDETSKSPKAESQPQEEDKVVTQTYTYRYPSGAYNFNIRTEPAKKSPEAVDSKSLGSENRKSSSVHSESNTEENDLEEEVFTETFSYKHPKSFGQSVERSSQRIPEPETTSYKTSSSRSTTEHKSEVPKTSDSTESNSRYQYKYRSPSRSYNFKTISQSEREEKADNQESALQQTDTVSSNRSSTSSMSNTASITQQSSQTKEVLSPALAPRSPGFKHLDKSPKYIFSMGSRTVVEPQAPKPVVESKSKDENENEELVVKEETVETAEQPDDDDDEVDPEDSMTAKEFLDLAKQKLEELHLAEAERLFMRCQKKLNAEPENNYQKLIEIYFGLSEVCTRRSKQSRKSPLEWQWLCVHAAALLAEAAELCALEAKSEDADTAEFYQEKREFAENRNKSLEDLLCRTLYNWLADGWRAIDPTSVGLLNALRKTNLTSSLFPMSNMLGLKPYQSGFLAQALSIESLHEMPSSLQGATLDTKSNWFRRIQLYCLKRMVNKNRQEVLDEVLQFSKDTKKNDSQDLGSDDEDEAKDGVHDEKPLDIQHDAQEEADADQNGEVHDDDANSDTEEHLEVTNSPLSQKPVKLTIAKVFHRVVARLIEEHNYTKAELLCEEILQIIEQIQDGTIRMLKFSGELQQNLGVLCLKQGDIAKGLACLEVALNIFRDLQDGDAHREVSLVLIDMGNAYVSSSLSEDQLYQSIIAAIRVFFEKEACDDSDQGETTPEMIRSKEQDPTNEEEEKRKENINEAVRCYQEALDVLEGNAQSDLETIAKAMMKLGDCYFIQTEYSKALDSYEKAVPMFKNANVFGKDHFLQQGHVMLMLGVATFMLHVYPRAATIFEIAYSMVKHAHRLEINTFLHALLLSLRGIANYKMKAYHKCVSLCYQAFEIFWNMHGEGVVKVSHERFWLICQNLYILGNSYNVLNLQHKAIKYLDIGRAFMRATQNGEKRQFIRILNILGDCYFAQYDYKTALVYYNEALEIGEPAKEEDHPDGEAATEDDMNQSTEDMALHNQLLSKSAEANISMNQYENAIEYLEQARDMQDVMGEDIKGDLVSTLYQLGQMHSMAGDVDKAIDSYKESLEVFKELHNTLGPEMCVTLGNLATMCYVKACICEDIDSELQMILAAEGYFQEALKLEMNQSVCVKYANFLYSQGNYEDAIMYLEDALKSRTNLPEIVYGGLEKVTLPEALQDEVDAQEEVEMPSVCLGHFLEVLSYKMLGKTRHSDKCLLKLLKSVYDTDSPFLRSVLGYGLMEMGLFEEAAVSFRAACEMDPEYHLALDNYCLCLCLMVLESLNSAMKNIFIHYKIWYDEMNPRTPTICELDV